MQEDEDVDIAAAMGFGSFGGTKKRKFDHSNSPQAKPDASGANSTKLGARPKQTSGSGEREDTKDTVTNTVNQVTQSQSQDSLAPSGLAAFLARGQTLPDYPLGSHNKDSPPSQIGSSATETISFGGPPILKTELTALRFGVKNENGDTAYFLSSFVEDPWEELIKNVGAEKRIVHTLSRIDDIVGIVHSVPKDLLWAGFAWQAFVGDDLWGVDSRLSRIRSTYPGMPVVKSHRSIVEEVWKLWKPPFGKKRVVSMEQMGTKAKATPVQLH